MITVGMSFTPDMLKKQVETGNFASRFDKAIQEIMDSTKNPETGKSYVANYLKELAGKSFVSFKHSVNVAAHVYDMMTNSEMSSGFSKEDVIHYTTAALLHDAGKLTTDNEILHSERDLNKYPEAKDDWKIMMRHSIDGLEEAKRLDFDKYAVFAVIGHHVGASAIESGPEGGFENATFSKKPWEEIYGEGSIEKMLMQECSWIGETDKAAMKIISFCDVVEAVRSNDRAYMKDQTHDWTIDGGTKKTESVSTIVNRDMSENTISHKEGESPVTIRMLGSEFKGLVEEKSFQERFQSIQDWHLENLVGDYVLNYAEHVKVKVYDDTLCEIKENPAKARALMETRQGEDGKIYFVFEHERLDAPIVVLPKIAGPDFEKGVIKDTDTIFGKENKEDYLK